MSVQQSKVRYAKFQKMWDSFQSSGNFVLDDVQMQDIYALRCVMWSFDTSLFSMAERNYLDTRWPMIGNVMMSGSAEELVMKCEVGKLGSAYTAVDYLAVITGLLMDFTESSMDVCIALIDSRDELDSFFKSAKCTKALLKIAFAQHGMQMRCKKNAFKLIAHILKKFPSLKTQRHMLSKRNNVLRCKFTNEMIEKCL